MSEYTERIEREIEDLKTIAQDLQEQMRRIVGSGVIEITGNRFKIDVSGALSQYAKTSDIPTVPATPDLSTYAKKNDVRRLNAQAVKSQGTSEP